MFRSLFKIFILAPCLLSICVSVQAEDSNNVYPYVINGERAPARRAPIAKITWTTNIGGKKYKYLCSGTLIAKKQVLSAAHCVTAKPKNYRIVLGGKTYRLRRIRKHPNYVARPGGGNDVAIFTLRNPVAGIAPQPIVSRDTYPVSIGNLIAIYGYGKTEKGTSGRLYGGFSIVGVVYDEFIGSYFYSYDVSSVCSGDSGGPAFLVGLDGAGKYQPIGLVGATSWGTTNTCGIGTETYFTNLQTPTVFNFIRKRVPRVKVR